MGTPGAAIATAWNALMAGAGATQAAQDPRNTGMTLAPPRDRETEEGRRVREHF